jgi:signal transduction histidine kinase/ActR/RegA family two-component response regulator
MATHDLSEEQPDTHRMGRRGSVLLVLLIAVALSAAVTALALTGHERAEPFIMVLLAAVGAIGVFALLAMATGILRVAGDDLGNSWFKGAVDAADEGLAITDAAGRVVYANSAYRALVGAANLADIPSIERAFGNDPAGSEAIYRLFKSAREGRKLQEDLRIAPVTGDAVRWIKLSVRPLTDRGRRARLALWSASDATHEHVDDAFRGLQHAIDDVDHAPVGVSSVNDAGKVVAQPEHPAEQRPTTGVGFMRFFQNTPMAIATVNRAGTIARANGLFTRLFQSTRLGSDAHSEGASILDIVADRDRAALEAHIGRAARRHGESAPLDAALAGKGERWARFYVTPVDQDDEEAAIVYALEITEQRSLENQFLQSQKLETVGQLAGGLAHDFNNVLSAIMMATDFLLNAHRPSDPSFADIMQIKQNANRAAGLVRQLLAFSRRQTLRPQVLDLGEALADLSILLRRLIGEKVTLELHARDVWPVKADLSQFEQVIVNLAVNARDAMPNGGKLTVRASNVTQADTRKFEGWSLPAGDYVLVEIADSGTGIAPDIINRIFEPFFSTKDVGKGTGLGLSTVYGIVKQTGGFIYPQSEVDRGTAFRIYLPRYTPTPDDVVAPKPAAPENRSPRPADDTGQGTILLVEDEEGLRGLNARGLASRGYSVLEAGNGVEAIEVMERHSGTIDLVVSDVVMPEMDGPALLKELRQRRPQLRIIFVSGYAEEAFAKSLPEGGQFEFLPKPFTLKQLIAKVKDTMAEQAQARSA